MLVQVKHYAKMGCIQSIGGCLDLKITILAVYIEWNTIVLRALCGRAILKLDQTKYYAVYSIMRDGICWCEGLVMGSVKIKDQGG